MLNSWIVANAIAVLLSVSTAFAGSVFSSQNYNRPSYDQFAGGSVNGSSFITFNVTTVSPRELILLTVRYYSMTSIPLANVSSAGLTFTQLVSYTGESQTQQVYWAIAPTPISNQAITITLPGTLKASAAAMTFKNVNQLSPVGTPALNSTAILGSQSATASATITPGVQKLLVAIEGHFGNTPPVNTPPGYTAQPSMVTSNGGGPSVVTMEVSNALTNTNTLSPSYPLVAPSEWTMILIPIK